MFDFYPEKLWTRDEVMGSPCPVRAVSGVYFWWFTGLPSNVPLDGCVTIDGHTLLYVGISPDKKGRPNSRATLKTRIKTHYSGNAEGSTLRRTLGVLLLEESNFPLRRVGSGKRKTFTHSGEQWLDEWMAINAKVHWVPDSEPWVIEERLLSHFSLPLNIQGNNHIFRPLLSAIRSKATTNAKLMDIADETGLSRRLKKRVS